MFSKESKRLKELEGLTYEDIGFVQLRGDEGVTSLFLQLPHDGTSCGGVW